MPPRGQLGVGQSGKQALLTQDPTPDNGKDQRLRQQGAGYLEPGWGPQETSVYALGWPVSPGAPPGFPPHPRPRLMTPRLSGRGMVIWAELEIRGPTPEKRKTCIQTVWGAGRGLGSDTPASRSWLLNGWGSADSHAHLRCPPGKGLLDVVHVVLGVYRLARLERIITAGWSLSRLPGPFPDRSR